MLVNIKGENFMRAKIRQLFCLIVIVIIALAIGAAAINVYMVWGTKGRILKKDQWANFKADGVVVLGCAVRPNKEASPMLNDRCLLYTSPSPRD